MVYCNLLTLAQPLTCYVVSAAVLVQTTKGKLGPARSEGVAVDSAVQKQQKHVHVIRQRSLTD